MRRTRRGGRQDRPNPINETLATESPFQNLNSTARPQGPKYHNNQRNSMNEPGNGRPRVFKPRFVKKSELDSLSNEVKSLNLGEGANERREEEVETEGITGEVSTSNKGKSIKEKKGEVPQSSGAKDDEFSRLEELRLRVQEPELSEEQLRINDQLQEDELLAMESIYGENVNILGRQRDLRSFQIHIHIETPGEIAVTAILNQSSHLETSSNSSNDFSYSFNVEYLQPIVLTCLLPKSYPSHLPPFFTISVRWLDPLRISKICSMLDSLWTEQVGQEVVYKWVEWIFSSTLSYLEFDGELKLGPYGKKLDGDIHAVSGSISPDVDIPAMRSYNDERHHDNFRKNLHECSICLSEYPGNEFVRLSCRHFFCLKCMQTYSVMHVNDGTVAKLQCPDAKCEGMVPPGLLKGFLGAEEFERWESLTLQKTLESMSDIVYCPRCETPCIEDEDQDAQCSKCFFSFCTLCRERRHVGVACLTPELKLLILQKRQSSSQLHDGQRRKEREMINEIISVKEILRDAKQCPSCRMAISRTEGCNKMVCNNCGQYFCYRCNKAIDGYDHFRDGACQLFPQEMVQEWEERINDRQIVGQIQVQLFPDNRHLCPNCGQPNVKVGNNNHILCWACQVHHCYLCKRIVKRSSQHFGPKGCKQHTVG